MPVRYKKIVNIKVREFEKEAFRLFREDTGKIADHWARFSDGCGAQFRSQFCNSDLIAAPRDLQVKSASFHFFEANEGKNISDSAGSIAKCAYMRAVSRREVEGITSASEVVDIINNNLSEDMPKFKVMRAVHFPQFQRIAAEDRSGVEFYGIMSTHSITLRSDGLIADQLSCLSCTVSEICPACLKKELVVETQGNEEYESDSDRIYDDEDDGQTDDESSDEEEGEFNRGDIVWGKYGKNYYPAKVVGKKDTPAEYHEKLFGTHSSKHAVVRWYGENRYSRILYSRMKVLAESREDIALAAARKDIRDLYDLAMSELRND